MKSNLFKLSLSLLLITVAGFSFAQNNIIKFEKNTLKFGKVDEGDSVNLTYYFQNLGKHSLKIIPPVVDCSCTEVIVPENEIAGGEKDSITIFFDTNDKIGYQEREVHIQFVSDFMDSNAIDHKIVFKGIVKASKETKETYKKNKEN